MNAAEATIRRSGSKKFLILAPVLSWAALLLTAMYPHSSPGHSIWALLVALAGVIFAIWGAALRGQPGYEIGRMIGALCLELYDAQLFLLVPRINEAAYRGWAMWAFAAILISLAWVFVNNARKAILYYWLRKSQPQEIGTDS